MKGALIAVYGLSDDEAFALLRWHSQQSNTKIHDLATRILDRIGQPDLADQPVRRKITLALTSISRQETVLPPGRAPRPCGGQHVWAGPLDRSGGSIAARRRQGELRCGHRDGSKARAR